MHIMLSSPILREKNEKMDGNGPCTAIDGDPQLSPPPQHY